MLAYTKRMNDIKRLRGINVYKNYSQQNTDYSLAPPLHINNVSTSRSLDLSMDSNRKLYGTSNRLIRSLGTIKLEPLLGSQKSEIDNMSVKVYKVEKDRQMDRETVLEDSRKVSKHLHLVAASILLL